MNLSVAINEHNVEVRSPMLSLKASNASKSCWVIVEDGKEKPGQRIKVDGISEMNLERKRVSKRVWKCVILLKTGFKRWFARNV